MVLSMERWKGKVAIVTGASVGIGASIAEALVKQGLKVVGLARRKGKIEELAQKLLGEKGKLYAVQTDLSKEEDIINAFKYVKENLGPVDILINNAAYVAFTSLVDGDASEWKNVFDVNVLGLSIATREAVKSMRENKIDGHIIHINSLAGHRIPPNIKEINVYPASKFAVTALTETLRQELNSIGSKIKITSLSPGPTESEMSEKVIERFNLPGDFFKSILKAEDVADGVIYVLSTPPHVQVHELMIRPLGYAT